MVLIKLKIRFVDGTDTTISIDDQATIATLHQSIAASTSVPIAEQRLIFKGKVLSDDQRKIRDCGLSNDIVIHLVRRTVPQIPSPRVNNVVNEEAGGAANQNGSTEHISRTISHIIGQVPFERNGIFADPNQTMSIIGNIIQQLESRFRIDTQYTLHLNQPQHNDFSINVRLRGVRQQFFNSPARERFETLCIELRKLAWLVVLIKAQFLGEVDAILSAEGQQTTEDQQCRAMAHVLRAMNAYDHYDEVEMNNYVLSNYVVGAPDNELASIIEQLGHWQLDEDEAHIQQLNPVISVRHCTSHDLSTFLMMFSVVQAKISEYLMDRYYRVLQSPHIHQVSSHPARMLNCFSNAMARVQHYCAHIYHGLSDLSLHADQNPHNRLYPQLVIHQRHENEEPGLSQAEINFVFSDPSNDQNGRQPPIHAEHPQRANGQIPGQHQPPQPSARIFPGPSANRNSGQGRPFRFPSPQLNERQIAEDLRLFQRQPSTQNGSQRINFNPNQRPMDDHRQPSPPNQPHPPQNNNDQPPQPSQQAAAPANPVNSILSGLLNIAQFVGIGGGVADHLQQQPAPPPARPTQQQHRPVAMRMAEAVSVPRSTGLVQPPAATTTLRQQQNPPPPRQLPPRQQRQSIQFEYQRQPMAATTFHQFMAQPSATGGTTNSTATTGRSSQTPPPFPTQPPPPPLAQQQYRSISAERVMGRGGPRRMQIPVPSFGAALGFQQQNVNWGRTGSNEARAMFIGPNEPTEFPMFTMDRFLACPSRRYRLFEMDSRHFNFWNDPRAIARGIEPPPNSIAGLERAGGPPPAQAPESAEAFESLFNLEPRPQANANGDAIFNEIGQFAQFAQRLLENVANCMARQDVRLLLPGSVPLQRGFTAHSRVAGYTPFVAIPVPFPVPSPTPPPTRSAASTSTTSARPGPSFNRARRGGFSGRRFGRGGNSGVGDDPMDLG